MKTFFKVKSPVPGSLIGSSTSVFLMNKFPRVILHNARSKAAHLSLGMTPVTKLTKDGNKAIEAKKLKIKKKKN